MTAAQTKLLVFIAVVLALWRAFEVPAITNAFFAFCTLGIIPGSTHAIPTKTIIRVACILFALSVFLIFRKEFIASLPQRAPKAPKPVKPTTSIVQQQFVQAQPAVPVAVVHENPAIVVLTQQKTRPSTGGFTVVIRALSLVCIGIIRATLAIEQAVTRMFSAIFSLLRRIISAIYQTAVRGTKQLYRAVYKTIRVIIALSILAWQLSEPHIRAFDHWLDVRLHRNATIAEALEVAGEMAKTASGMYRKLLDYTHKTLHDH